MKYPDSTKNTSTATNAPDTERTPAWNRTTRRIAMPRSPSRSGLNTDPPRSPAMAQLTGAAGRGLQPDQVFFRRSERGYFPVTFRQPAAAPRSASISLSPISTPAAIAHPNADRHGTLGE